MAQDVPLSVFVSYSHRDEELRERLDAHLAQLRRDGRIALWHDRKIRGGEEWADRISDHLETADLVLFLVSADLLASDYCMEVEMRRALERHAAGKSRVVPIVLRHCDWQSAPFGKLQALPRDGRPVVSWDDPDAAWTDVARQLRALADELREARAAEPSEPEPRYPNDRIRDGSRQLRDAYRRREALIVAEGDVRAVDEEIAELRRRLREDGLQAGDLLAQDRFQLIAKVGSGGFATVWKAYDRRKRTPVAVKVLHAQYAHDASRRKRFFRGAREMAALRHPGVVRVIEEEGRDGRFYFFVMEFVDDGDFEQAVRMGRLPDVRERLRLILEVGDALAYAHERGVIHRDVKPANVLLDAAGRARLTDFDLVKAIDPSASTRTGSMLGTWVYAAPEAMSDARNADERADVYGLGMTAVFAVHGRDLPPVVLRDAPGFVGRLDVDGAVRSVLARAVEWDKQERFESVEAFCEALRQSLEVSSPPARRERAKSSPLEELFQWIETPHDGRVELWREIPAGTFQMGSPKGEGPDRERPRHPVTITAPFRMAAVPVTNAQFAAFDANHQPYGWEGVPREELAYHPVVGVTWKQAMDFCGGLAKTFEWARGARLPTEEEWEHACRAGTETRYWSGDGEKDLARVGWYQQSSGGRTHRVGEKPANPWGLYDVHGNVLEWTLSPVTEDYSGRDRGFEVDPSTVDVAALAATGGLRVMRGGCYWVAAVGARAAFRGIWDPVVGSLFRGFRVVLPAGPAAPGD